MPMSYRNRDYTNDQAKQETSKTLVPNITRPLDSLKIVMGTKAGSRKENFEAADCGLRTSRGAAGKKSLHRFRWRDRLILGGFYALC
jgi:hypothetical protein